MMINRKLRELGVHPILGYISGLLSLILMSEFCYYKTEYAHYLIAFITLSLVSSLSDTDRSDFLLNTFGSTRKRNIRILENLILSLPFLVILIIKGNYLTTLLVMLMSFLLAIFSFHTKFTGTLPTPFSKHPFEFATGFRKSFYLFPLVYTLTIIAIIVGNVNLGIFSILVVFLICMGYYSNPEAVYFVWQDNNQPKGFLIDKLKIAIKHIAVLSTPPLVILLISFPTAYLSILLLYVVGLLFLIVVILAKYSTYPKEMNIPEGILITVALFFPPLLLAIIPYFYLKSANNLKLILNDKD